MLFVSDIESGLIFSQDKIRKKNSKLTDLVPTSKCQGGGAGVEYSR